MSYIDRPSLSHNLFPRSFLQHWFNAQGKVFLYDGEHPARRVLHKEYPFASREAPHHGKYLESDNSPFDKAEKKYTSLDKAIHRGITGHIRYKPGAMREMLGEVLFNLYIRTARSPYHIAPAIKEKRQAEIQDGIPLLDARFLALNELLRFPENHPIFTTQAITEMVEGYQGRDEMLSRWKLRTKFITIFMTPSTHPFIFGDIFPTMGGASVLKAQSFWIPWSPTCGVRITNAPGLEGETRVLTATADVVDNLNADVAMWSHRWCFGTQSQVLESYQAQLQDTRWWEIIKNPIK